MQRPRPPSASSSSSPRSRSRAGPDGESGSASRARRYMSHRSSPSRSRTPSQSRSPSRSKRSASRPPSRRSSAGQHSCRRVPSQQEKGHSRGKLIRDSAGLLLGIGVAAVVAHKFWPRGMLYGGKEEWETRLDKAAGKLKDKARDKVLGDDNGHDCHDPNVRCRRHCPPRQRERGRSMHRDRVYYYESEKLAGERAPAPPLPRSRSRSCRERVPTRGRSMEPARTGAYYQEAVDNTARWERLEPAHHQQGRREPSYASERCYYQPRVDLGRQVHRHDEDFIVVDRDVPRHGGRDYR